MSDAELNIVTGAYGFTGRYIAGRLLEQGKKVRTLTGHPEREHPFKNTVPAALFNFEDPGALTGAMEGASTLFNTYWIRMEQRGMTFEKALDQTAMLLESARKAGVRRVVHVSIVHADESSPYPYFRAKGRGERIVRESGLDYAILRPTIMFGRESLLFNNIAWLLRKMPMFAIPGKGNYRLQPVHVEDVAEQAVAAAERTGPEVFDMAGPETPTFEETIKMIARATRRRVRITHVKPERLLQMSKMLSGMVDDVLLTREEIDGLMANLLTSEDPPRGRTVFSEWVRQHASDLGTTYLSETGRHFR